jgi:ribosomal protein S18 acetylase RimI-like enzyme
LKALVRLYAEVFETQSFTMPSAGYLQALLEKEHVMFFTALSGGEVVGGLTAYVLPSVYFEKSEIYIYDLAVATEYQRKGIGRQLINALKEYCKEAGREIFVQADIEDQHAIDFYKATGGRSEDVIHFSYDLEK